MTLLIIVCIVVLLVLWVISVQRKLVSSEELVKNAMSQIGVQQNSRWDALSAIAELVKGYDEHEYHTLMDVISQRSKIDRNSTPEEVQAQEAKIADALKEINLVVERYPELKASELYSRSMDSVNTYENQVRMSRMTYNDTVTKYNQRVRQIPDSIIASMLHFGVKNYLEEPTGKTEMPSMK